MKRRTWRPEEAVSGRERYPRIFVNVNLGKNARPAIKQGVMLRRVVTDVWHLLILAPAVTTEDKGFARVVVPTLTDRQRLFVSRRVACADDTVRSHFGKKDNQEDRRQKASSIVFLCQCQDKVPHNNIQV